MKAIVIILGWLLLGTELYAETVKKEFQKVLDKSGINEVIISNRYGQIEVEQKEGNQIEVSAIIAVTAKSGSKADELLEYININEVTSGSFLSVETTFGKDMTFKQMFSGVEVTINYKVIIPQGIKLRLINTEGNVFVDRFAGELNVDIKSGNFQGGTFQDGEFLIKQSDGSFSVADVALLNGDFKGCDLKIENGKEVKLVTSGCDGRLESIDQLNITSKGGEMKLGQIEHLSGTSSSTKYEIQDIGDELKMSLKMGEINVRNIHFNFSVVELKGSFTKVGLTFMEGAGYNLELKHNKSLKMDLPRHLKLEQRPTSEKNIVVETGFVGDKKYNGKVFIDVRNGNLYIQ